MVKAIELRRHARNRDTRESQLIDAALRCISELGLRDTTVQDVAERAGMAVGSINQYFESKEQLFTAALRALSEEFEMTWQRGLEQAGADVAARLRCFVECYFEPAICQRKKVAVWFAFWGEVKARPKYRAVCAGYDRSHDDTLEALCRALLRQSPDPSQDARNAAKIIASVCHGLWLELLTGSDGLKRGELARLALATLAAVFPEHAAAFLLPRTNGSAR
ncbi:MAG: TetR family transcriptional regulator C-terminal domain-containing protein [Steroidobacteraceae bacterium]